MARKLTVSSAMFATMAIVCLSLLFASPAPALASTAQTSQAPKTLTTAQQAVSAGTVTKYTASSYAAADFTFTLPGLGYGTYVGLASDSNKKGGSWIQWTEGDTVVIHVYGAGTHTIKLSTWDTTYTCKAVLRQLSIKRTGEIKETGALVTCPKHRSKLAVKLTGVKKPKVTWYSTRPKVATVSKTGVVTGKKVGRCYVKAKIGGATVRVLVEVTTSGAYAAVRNAFYDMHQDIAYSQSSRMSAGYRDCSSFVSRCYWDDSQGRCIAVIGEEWVKYWAYPAAYQAQWLNSNGQRVAWKACALSKLRPGDTVYYETDYAGKDATQWRYIDHAALYVGNGLIMETGGSGGKGTVGLSVYWPKDKSVKFIGRPCP